MYNNIRKKINKFYNGGQIPKFQAPFGGINYSLDPLDPMMGVDGKTQVPSFTRQPLVQNSQEAQINTLAQTAGFTDPQFDQRLVGQSKEEFDAVKADVAEQSQNVITEAEGKFDASQRAARKAQAKEGFNSFAEGLGFEEMTSKNGKFSISAGAQMGLTAAVGAVNAIDDLTMGDKNFGAQSEAIDQAVHGVSGALMKSGNPYAFAAGVALEGANFLTKAGGQTVQGFDVDINSSGYGNLGHQASSSSRSLLGIGNRNLQAKLDKRNAQARMALEAADIAEDQRFEQDARMDSISNVVMNNQAALAGGVGLGSLGA